MKQNDEHQDERRKGVFWGLSVVSRQSFGTVPVNNIITLRKFVVTDSVVRCGVITARYKNVVKSQKYLQAL